VKHPAARREQACLFPTSGWREFSLIEAIRKISAASGSKDRLGIGDDASAHCPEPGCLELVTCDALIEGIHWEWAWCDPETLGRKAAAVNVSDIAAMGGVPRRAHLVLALPPGAKEKRVLGVVSGLVAELKKYGARLVGGDTNASPGPWMISLTLQGTVAEKHLLRRSGARAGDWLMVTGDLGGAAAGLYEVKHSRSPLRLISYAAQRLRSPIPRLAEARWLAQTGRVHALLDVSDGLASDVRRLCEAGRVGACLYAGHLPVAMDTRRMAKKMKQPAWTVALQGGEDYELLFAVKPQDAPALCRKMQARLGTACTLVGEVVPASQGLTLALPEGKMIKLPAGWEHNREVHG
jgi:thiamine-monophosphate kinase